jgi:hypothetical protein
MLCEVRSVNEVLLRTPNSAHFARAGAQGSYETRGTFPVKLEALLFGDRYPAFLKLSGANHIRPQRGAAARTLQALRAPPFVGC